MIYKKLVFSGGGIKGIAFIGALKVLNQYNILTHIDTYLGCSAGAIIALLVSLGYKHQELYRLFTKLNFANYQDLKMEQFLEKKGMDTGNKIIRLFSLIAGRKGMSSEATFEEHFKLTNKKLIMVGSNITRNRIKYFSVDETPHAKVMDALRITISYPYIFQPVIWENELYVDGGLLNHFPIKYFGEDCQDVLGIMLHDRILIEDRQNINESLEDYTLSILSAVADNLVELVTQGMEGKYIQIDIKNLHSMNFQKAESEKLNIYQAGIDRTYKFFEEKYKDIYQKYLLKKYFRLWRERIKK